MINNKSLQQEGGEKSTNLQGQNVNIYNGISYSDAKEIFTDLFSANFLHLKYEAADLAKERAEEITSKFLNDLNIKSPKSIESFKEPAMQDALFTAQKEYAKSGDKDLGDILVDILIDRAQKNSRTMLQLVLDEALKIASSLTVEQLDTLSLLFLLNRTISKSRSIVEFEEMIKRDIEPFVNNLQSDNNTFSYLEYYRCGYIRTGGYGNLATRWTRNYKGLFSKGISLEKIKNTFGDNDKLPLMIIPCLHDNSLFQIGVMNDEVLQEEMNKFNIPDEVRAKYMGIFNESPMSADNIKELIINTNPFMSEIFEMSDNSMFNRFELSSVGIAIAHANYRRRTGITLDLSLWIN